VLKLPPGARLPTEQQMAVGDGCQHALFVRDSGRAVAGPRDWSRRRQGDGAFVATTRSGASVRLAVASTCCRRGAVESWSFALSRRGRGPAGPLLAPRRGKRSSAKSSTPSMPRIGLGAKSPSTESSPSPLHRRVRPGNRMRAGSRFWSFHHPASDHPRRCPSRRRHAPSRNDPGEHRAIMARSGRANAQRRAAAMAPAPVEHPARFAVLPERSLQTPADERGAHEGAWRSQLVCRGLWGTPYLTILPSL